MGVHFKESEEKLTLSMIIIGIVIIGILIATLIAFLMNTNKEIENGEFAKVQEKNIGKVNSNDDFEDVSIEIGKKVEETKNEINSNSTTNNVNTTNTQNTTSKVEAVNSTKNNSVAKEVTNNSKTQKQESTPPKIEKEEIKFVAPIKGEILREFAPESLVYSNTLEEWITHNGVDIKADKTSVVTAAADGKVTSIKNDPRYGLTVIIEHKNGIQTVYANLLTAEFVVEGEVVKASQTIGTVGNSASFEIADDYHLHFEMIEDGNYLDPTNYIQF